MKRLVVLALVLAACGDNQVCDPKAEMCQSLSEWGFFKDIPGQVPADGVIPYDVNTALFSDYTTKQRFLYLPPGTAAGWEQLDALDLPVGAALIKTFSYLHDRRDPSGPRQLLETRVLFHRADGWHGGAYVYDGGLDAYYAEAGTILDASWLDLDGSTRTNAYVVPNANQCKTCHAEHDNITTPLGPKARHVNKDGWLEDLAARGQLTGAPADPSTWPKAPDAFDPASGSLDARARAWLDINCGHCHNPRGMARTSGLFLDISETAPPKYGVCKPPVATGRGSGGFAYDIVPGQPDASILVYRISHTEPEIRMPELGRNLVSAEGVALIREWIAAMSNPCSTAVASAVATPAGQATP